LLLRATGLSRERRGEVTYRRLQTAEGDEVRFSYRVFRAFGVDVRVHVTFVFIVAYFAVVWGALRKPGGGWGALYGVLLVILLFALVVIHELTHARVAQHYGIKVTSITLLPIGGLHDHAIIPSIRDLPI